MLKRVVYWTIALAVLFFFGKALYQSWDGASAVMQSMQWWSIFSIPFFVGAVMCSGVLWSVIMKVLEPSVKISARDGVRVHLLSWLLKYIPGQVGLLVNKIRWSSRRGISKKTTTMSVLYENILMVYASFFIGALFFVFAGTDKVDWVSIGVWAAILAGFMAIGYAPIFGYFVNLALKVLGRKKVTPEYLLSTNDIVHNALLYLAPRCINVVGMMILASAIIPLPIHELALIGAAFVLASIIGMLAFMVPGGLGVREGVFVLLCSYFMDTETAIALAVVTRLFTTVADIGVFGVYLMMNKWRLLLR